MSQSADATLDLKFYARMLWRRRGVIVLCAVVVLCASAVGLQFVPPEYESTATLRIEDRRRLASELEKVMGETRGGSARGYRADEARLDEMVARVESRPFLERVVRLLKMNEDPAVIATAQKALSTYPDATVDELAIRGVVKSLKSKISFRNPGMSNYQIIVADSDPRNAQLLAKWISELFADYSRQSSLEELNTAHEFGAEQEKIYQERLRTSELALEQYQQAAIQTDLERGFVRDDTVSRAEALYTQVLDEVDLARLRLLPLSRSTSDAGLGAAVDVMLADPQVLNQIRGLDTQLRETIIEVAGSSDARTPAEWPPGGDYLLAVRRGLFRLIERRTATVHVGQSAEARDLIGRTVFANLDYEAQSEVGAFLGQAIADFKLRAQASPRDEMELARLEGEVETNRTLLSSFRAQLIASDINRAMEVTNLGVRVEVLDPPHVPLMPVRPDKMKIFFAALVLGPLLGIGIAFISEIVDPTLRTISDFQRVFDGPVLGTVPLITGMGRKEWTLRRHWVAATVTCVLLLTALFFLTRTTMLPDFNTVSPPIKIVDPGSAITP